MVRLNRGRSWQRGRPSQSCHCKSLAFHRDISFWAEERTKKGFPNSSAISSSLGLFEVNTSGSNNRADEKKARVFATACNARICSANPAGTAKAEDSSFTKNGEIEKFWEPLNKGLLTQKEFDAKKADSWPLAWTLLPKPCPVIRLD